MRISMKKKVVSTSMRLIREIIIIPDNCNLISKNRIQLQCKLKNHVKFSLIITEHKGIIN